MLSSDCVMSLGAILAVDCIASGSGIGGESPSDSFPDRLLKSDIPINTTKTRMAMTREAMRPLLVCFFVLTAPELPLALFET